MHRTDTSIRFSQRLGLTTCGLAWAALSIFAGPSTRAQTIQFEIEIEDGQIIGQAEEAAEDPLGLLNTTPGFTLRVADEDLQQQIADLDRFFTQADWSKAFRLLTELSDEKWQMMVPLGDQGRHVLIKEAIRHRLASLPPDGRRAYQSYFDAQAAEQFKKINEHPLPGSDDQLVQTQRLVDRLLASSVGGQAAVLLGDMYFGRGLFIQAERAWQLALDHGSATGQAALELEAKRALALQRAGKLAQAQALSRGLSARYGQATIQAGGQTLDALALLNQVPDAQGDTQEQAARDTLPQGELLPKPDSAPHWHLQFLNPSTQDKTRHSRDNRGWGISPPADLLKFVPPVAADDQRVYFHWLGVVFALDRSSGKQVWRQGSLKTTAEQLKDRIHTNQGDPRNYRLAVGGGNVLVSAAQGRRNGSPLSLKAYDAATGQERWSSRTRQGWPLGEADARRNGGTSVLGQVLVAQGAAFTTVYQAGQSELFLRQFDPATGEVHWTLSLGTAEALNFQYTEIRRMPQPMLVMGPSLLYVMTNNGAVLAVDTVSREIKWAVRFAPPFGIGQPQDDNFFRGNQLSSKIEAMANTNGSGRLLLQHGTLYAKEHNGKTLLAIDPETGALHWSAQALKPDAKLIGIDDERFLVMNQSLQSYSTQGEHDLNAKTRSTGEPDHTGAIFSGGQILTYGSGKLHLFDAETLDTAGKFESADYLGTNGGHLYLFDDLLIAIDTTQITAFKVPTSGPNND